MTTRTVQEKHRETNSLTLSINFAELGFAENTETVEATEGEVPEATDSPTQPAQTSLSGITIQSTTSINASGSDIYKSDITWHHWDYPSEEIDLENGEVPSGPVFFGDLKSVNTNSLTYTYSNTPDGGESGTATYSHFESGEYFDENNEVQTTATTSTTVTVDLVTGEVTSDNAPNTPESGDETESTNSQEGEETTFTPTEPSWSSPPVTAVPGVFGSSYHLNDSYFRNNPFGIPCAVCHGVTGQGIVGPPNSFRFAGGAGELEFYGNLRDTAASGVLAAGILSGGYNGLTAVMPTGSGGSLLSFTPAQLASRYGLDIARVNAIAHDFLTKGAAIAYSPEAASALIAYRLIAFRIIEKYQQSINPSVVGTIEQLRRIQMIEQQLTQWGVPF